MYYLCEKYYKPITGNRFIGNNTITYKPIIQYYIANCVSWVPKVTLLDLRTHSQNGTCSYVGDLLYGRHRTRH